MEEEKQKTNKLWALAKEYKYWWLLPMLVLGAIIGIVLFSTGVFAPFVYTKF